MPIVQKALITWLTDALPCEKTDAKKFATTILPHVAKLGDAADKPLREAALNLLVVLAVTVRCLQHDQSAPRFCCERTTCL